MERRDASRMQQEAISHVEAAEELEKKGNWQA